MNERIYDIFTKTHECVKVQVTFCIILMPNSLLDQLHHLSHGLLTKNGAIILRRNAYFKYTERYTVLAQYFYAMKRGISMNVSHLANMHV